MTTSRELERFRLIADYTIKFATMVRTYSDSTDFGLRENSEQMFSDSESLKYAIALADRVMNNFPAPSDRTLWSRLMKVRTI